MFLNLGKLLLSFFFSAFLSLGVARTMPNVMAAVVAGLIAFVAFFIFFSWLTREPAQKERKDVTSLEESGLPEIRSYSLDFPDHRGTGRGDRADLSIPPFQDQL